MELTGPLSNLFGRCFSHNFLLFKYHVPLLEDQDLLLQLKVDFRKFDRFLLEPLHVLLELDYSSVSLVHELFFVELLLELVHVA